MNSLPWMLVALGLVLLLAAWAVWHRGQRMRRCLAELLALDPAVKVIIASGYSANGPVKEALEAGASGYLAKPFRRAELLATMKKALEEGPGPAAGQPA